MLLLSRRWALCAAAALVGSSSFASAGRPASRSLSSLLSLRGGEGELQAALFDFDGTLAQSEDTHRETFSTLLGFELTPEYWNAKCVGNSPRSILEKHLSSERLAAGASVDQLLQRRLESPLPSPNARHASCMRPLSALPSPNARHASCMRPLSALQSADRLQDSAL